MPSPFPGMDPWLESPGVFPDFHNSLIGYLREAINALLPPPFYTAIATRVYMEEAVQLYEPDVDVLLPSDREHELSNGNAVATLSVTDLLKVAKTPRPEVEMTEWFLEVRTAGDRERLVTSIEMLSPSNKAYGKTGRGMYLAKQLELCTSGVNLVEIDLLRRGAHATLASLTELRRKAGRFDYHVCVTTTEDDESSFVAPFFLEQPLPVIPIPLTQGVPAIPLDLRSAFTRTFDAALYSRRLRYQEPCDPPLTTEQQAWAEGILREKGVLK